MIKSSFFACERSPEAVAVSTSVYSPAPGGSLLDVLNVFSRITEEVAGAIRPHCFTQAL